MSNNLKTVQGPDIRRVPADKAAELVGTGAYKYVPKSVWREHKRKQAKA